MGKLMQPMRGLVFALVMILSGCGDSSSGSEPVTVTIPAGSFFHGSDRAEREMAYRLDEKAYGHSATRDQKWYENEPARSEISLPAYGILKNPVTNRDYARFIAATGYPAPDVDRKTWDDYGLIHPYERTRRFAWIDGKPPKGRETHPVVMVSWHDAEAYAAWFSVETGIKWRLPTEREWEKAARGPDGPAFPWGDIYDASLLNSDDSGPFDTLPVNSFPDGASPYGMLDAAGQVFEWTATKSSGTGRHVVKGGSWDDSGCGVCRPAARHGRPDDIKHILVGFRLVHDAVE